MLKPRNRFEQLQFELDQVVVVILNVLIYQLTSVSAYGLELGRRNLGKGAVIGCDNCSRTLTAVDERDLSKVVASFKKFLIAGGDSFIVFNFHFTLTLGDEVEKGAVITLTYNLIIWALNIRRYANNQLLDDAIAILENLVLIESSMENVLHYILSDRRC